MLEPGFLLNYRYEIQAVVGEGGMGSVYLALDCNLGRKKVAVKEMAVAARRADEKAMAIEQFRQEARLLASLEHARLVPVTDFFESDDSAYLVMAFVEGQTLTSVAAGRSVQMSEVVEWIDQVAQILEYLHEHQPPVLFRDLKPSNVMLDDRGQVRLIDFGIARTLEVGEGTNTFLKGAGTAEYAPVEQFGGRGTDARSDLYSLGATMYNLLTGELPPIAVDVLTGEAPPADPRAVHPDIPPALEAVVRKAMAIKKDDRYACARDLRLDLARVSPAELSAVARPPRPRPGRTPSRPLEPMTERARPGLLIPPPPSPSYGALPDIPSIPRPPQRNPIAPALVGIVLLILGSLLWSAATTTAVQDVSAEASEATASAAPTATLYVESHPPGAHVWIDDRPALGRKGEQVTPMGIVLPPGKHVVRVEKEGAGTFMATAPELQAGQARRVEADLVPAPSAKAAPTPDLPLLHVASRPPGAHVIVDDSLVMEDRSPVTTPASIPLELGRHRIQLEATGYETFTTYIRITDRQRRDLDARLVPAISGASRPLHTPPAPEGY